MVLPIMKIYRAYAITKNVQIKKVVFCSRLRGFRKILFHNLCIDCGKIFFVKFLTMLKERLFYEHLRIDPEHRFDKKFLTL